MEPGISLDEAKRIVAGKAAPKVTGESMKRRIASVDYVRHKHLTICIITMVNEFFVVGVSAPASTANYTWDVGQRYAYENAFRQLWQLEGYLLRQTLNDAPQANPA